MVFGSKLLFAVELDIVQHPFGFARLWVHGQGIGDYTVPSAVPSIVEKLLAQQVGAALGKNPWPIVVPCHRVTAANGAQVPGLPADLCLAC